MTQDPDDIDQWLAELAGGDTARGEQSESTSLRRVIRAEAAQADAVTDPRREAHALQQLMFRLRSEHLLPRRRLPVWSLALAATLAAAAVGLYVMRQPEVPGPDLVAYGEAPIWRGAYARFEVRDAKARLRAEQLVAALRAEGLQVDIYASGPVYTVDTELAAPIPRGALEQFKSLGLTVKPGRLRIEIRP